MSLGGDSGSLEVSEGVLDTRSLYNSYPAHKPETGKQTNKQQQQQNIYTITKIERQSVNQSASIREDTIGHYWLPVLLPVNELSLLNNFQIRLHISLFFRRSTHCHYAYIYIKREATRCHLLDHH